MQLCDVSMERTQYVSGGQRLAEGKRSVSKIIVRFLVSWRSVLLLEENFVGAQP
jgi:hypothetical protein